MAKKIIQVPFDNELLIEVNHLSKKKGKSRAELIRDACTQYISNIKNEDLDHAYVRGYEKIPEKTEIGEAQLLVLPQILVEEKW